ncbi:MAG: 1-acyl-sn-glycerol-3-phosphate acyltransferase [Actinobacteria bacterium]|nr:1-acyl-sn-glycerol-3-phosphate acyltransferase [Actinomycetota bacterium]
MLKTRRGKSYLILYKFLQFILSNLFRVVFRIKVIDSKKIPKEGGLILCSNHLGYLDPFFICVYFPRLVYFMAKIELFKSKSFASLITFFNAFPVKRESADRKAITNALKVLTCGQVLGMFPEGTRSTDGTIGQGYRGVGLIAVMSKAPILPMAIAGTNKIIRKPHKRIFFPRIKLIFGDLIRTEDIVEKYDKKTAIDILLKKVMDSIEKLYNQINV